MRERDKAVLMRVYQRALGILLLILSVIILSPMQAAAESVTSGTMGDNGKISWSYDGDTDTLTLSGADSGLKGNKEEGSPFLKEFGLIRKIVLDDVTLIGNANYLFANLTELETIEMKKVDTSQVTSMAQMFENCSSLISVDFSNWDTSRVTTMVGMFHGCSSLTNLDISTFDTSKVTSFYWLLRDCSNLERVKLGDISTEQVKSMEKMFAGCGKLTKLDLSAFDTKQVTSMGGMFENCAALTELDLGGFSTDSLVNMPNMFSGCSSLEEIDISNFNTSGVTSFYGLFTNCSSLVSIDLKGINTSKVNKLERLFAGCSSLKQVNLSGLDFSQVTNMVCMFKDCSSLIAVDLSGLNTSKVTQLASMFENCNNLQAVNLKDMDTSGVTTMYAMFKGCSKLNELDLSNFYATRVENVDAMLKGCEELDKIKTPREINPECPIALPVTFYNIYGKETDKITKEFCNMNLMRICPENPFADVKMDSWQFTSAKYALDNGLMSGKGNDEEGKIKFDPDKNMVRAEFVQTLYNKEGKPTVSFTNKFSDVKSKDWFASAIMWASEKEIVAGKGTYFDVSGNITRQEIAVILYKYAKYLKYDVTGGTDLMPYADDEKIDTWAKTAMEWAVSKGIMKGKGNGDDLSTYKLAPRDAASRAECAAMLKNFMEAYK